MEKILLRTAYHFGPDKIVMYLKRDHEVTISKSIFNARLKEWQDYYNYDRPRGGLDRQTPYGRLRQKRKPAGARK